MIDHKALAKELLAAYHKGEKASSPTSRDPNFSVADGFAVEQEQTRLRIAQGAKVVGRKVGFANKAMWRIMKLDTLVWANMYDDTVRYAKDNHATLSLDRIRSAKLEPEIVLLMRERLQGDNLDAATALRAVEWVGIGFEIIDCPYPEWQFQPADFMASLGLHAALIVGDRKPVQPGDIESMVEALPKVKVKVFKNGELVEEGSGKNSLRSPALCLGELARAIDHQPGSAPLQAGELISTGTLTGGHLLSRGETWRVDVEGLPLASLKLTTV